MELVRQGRRQSTASVRMVQDGLDRVRATATFGTLPASYPEFPAGPTDQPTVAAPEDCFGADALATAIVIEEVARACYAQEQEEAFALERVDAGESTIGLPSAAAMLNTSPTFCAAGVSWCTP